VWAEKHGMYGLYPDVLLSEGKKAIGLAKVIRGGGDRVEVASIKWKQNTGGSGGNLLQKLKSKWHPGGCRWGGGDGCKGEEVSTAIQTARMGG